MVLVCKTRLPSGGGSVNYAQPVLIGWSPAAAYALPYPEYIAARTANEMREWTDASNCSDKDELLQTSLC